MRTTVTLDDDLLSRAQELSGLSEPQLQGICRRRPDR